MDVVMGRDETSQQEPRQGVVFEEPIAAHLSLDAGWDQLTVIEFGSVWDGQPDEQCGQLVSDERLLFLFREPGGPVIGFMVREPHEFEAETLDDPELWERPPSVFRSWG